MERDFPDFPDFPDDYDAFEPDENKLGCMTSQLINFLIENDGAVDDFLGAITQEKFIRNKTERDNKNVVMKVLKAVNAAQEDANGRVEWYIKWEKKEWKGAIPPPEGLEDVGPIRSQSYGYHNTAADELSLSDVEVERAQLLSDGTYVYTRGYVYDGDDTSTVRKYKILREGEFQGKKTYQFDSTPLFEWEEEESESDSPKPSSPPKSSSRKRKSDASSGAGLDLSLVD